MREAGLTQRELMQRYSVSKSTIIKWQRREDVEDRSHRAHTPHTTLPVAQELVISYRRPCLMLHSIP